MSQKRLNLIEYSEWIIWIFIIALLIGLYYQSMILKNINNQIIESTLAVLCLTSIVFIRKFKLQIDLGLIKVYRKRNGFNSIMSLGIGLGVLWLIIGFLSLIDINAFIFRLTLCLCFIIGGLSIRCNPISGQDKK